MNKERKLEKLIEDLRSYSTVLIALSVFLYIGIILEGFNRSNEILWILMITLIVLLFLAFSFLHLSKKLQKKLNEEEEEKF